VAARAVGPLVEQEILPPSSDAAADRLEGADHLLELERRQMALRAARNGLSRVSWMMPAAEAVDGVRAEHVDRSAGVSSRGLNTSTLSPRKPAFTERSGANCELVAEPDAATDSGFGPVVEVPREVRGRSCDRPMRVSKRYGSWNVAV